MSRGAPTTIDTRTPGFRANADAMLALLGHVTTAHDQALERR